MINELLQCRGLENAARSIFKSKIPVFHNTDRPYFSYKQANNITSKGK